MAKYKSPLRSYRDRKGSFARKYDPLDTTRHQCSKCKRKRYECYMNKQPWGNGNQYDAWICKEC
jgi:hypothetical protein